jgi:hypothetical protein
MYDSSTEAKLRIEAESIAVVKPASARPRQTVGNRSPRCDPIVCARPFIDTANSSEE